VKEVQKGSILILIAYGLWGFFPFYWVQLAEVSSIEIIAYRILFSFITCFFYLVHKKQVYVINVFKDKKKMLKFTVISLLLFVNWFVFIYAVSQGKILDAGMGYYLNPLISILLGMLFLKEKLNKFQIAAFILATIGIIYYIFSIGEIPYIAITLGTTFGLYGLFKKKTKISGIHSMSIETMILTPIAIGVLLFIGRNNHIAIFSGQLKTIIFIVLAGIVTLTPLVLFAEATKRIPLIRAGFLQLIAPTLMLFSGLVMGEVFTINQIISFSFIWIALILYVVSIVKGDISDRKNNKGVTS